MKRCGNKKKSCKCKSCCKVVVCKEPKRRTFGGLVQWTNISITDNLPTCPGNTLFCSQALVATPNILTGSDDFTVANMRQLILQVPCPNIGECPFNSLRSRFSFDVIFKKPFKETPVVVVNQQNAQLFISDNCAVDFTLPFSGTGETLAPQLNGCDDTTTFLITLNGVYIFSDSITPNGFTYSGYAVVQGCPVNGGAIPPSDLCNATLIFASVILGAPEFNYAATFIVTGK